MRSSKAKFNLGAVVRHKYYKFRGVVFDIDPIYDNTEEWLLSIPQEIRPDRNQPFYHLYAENEETEYVAYVSEQNLEYDDSDKPLRHPDISKTFTAYEKGAYKPLNNRPN